MGCGVSNPETDEGGGGRGGGDKVVTPQGSIGKGSETADSSILGQELSTHSKKSKTGGETTCKEEEVECKDHEEEKGDELKNSPASPSFRIYCVFPRDPNDANVIDELPPNKYISDENKKQKGGKQEAVGMKIKRRFNNVKKLLIPPTLPPSASS